MFNKRIFNKIFLVCLTLSFVFAYSLEVFSQSRSSARSSSSSRTRSSSSSSARSSSSSSARSSSSSRTRSSSSRTRTSIPASSTAAATTTTGTTSTTETVSNPCDVGKVLKNDGGQYYYTQTKTCNQPSNTAIQNWSESVNDFYSKSSWIDASEAVYFACETGYIQSGDVCVSSDTICPLNVIVGMPITNVSYTNPTTGASCTKPTNTSFTTATQADIDDLGLDYTAGKAATLTCLANYFSAPASGSSSHLQCVRCPNGGTTESYGATSVQECSTYSQVAGNSLWENYGGGVSSSSSTSSSTVVSSSKYTELKDAFTKFATSYTGLSFAQYNSINQGISELEALSPTSSSFGTKYNLLKNTFFDIDEDLTSTTDKNNFNSMMDVFNNLVSSSVSSDYCKAGTYKNGSSCSPCPDYQWSDDNATFCSPMKFKFFRSNHNSTQGCYNIVSKWVDASSKTLQCTGAAFGDSDTSSSKGCGGPCDHMVGTNGTLNFSSCKKLPCVVSNGVSNNPSELYFINEKGVMYKWHKTSPNVLSVKTEKLVDW